MMVGIIRTMTGTMIGIRTTIVAVDSARPGRRRRAIVSGLVEAVKHAAKVKKKAREALIYAGHTSLSWSIRTNTKVGIGRQYWTRTSDLYDVNVAL